jgi:hypothetical protein
VKDVYILICGNRTFLKRSPMESTFSSIFAAQSTRELVIVTCHFGFNVRLVQIEQKDKTSRNVR